jgi:hypothetical protein
MCLGSLGGLPPINHTAQIDSGVFDATNGSGDNSVVTLTYSGLSLSPGYFYIETSLDGNPAMLTFGGAASGVINLTPNTTLEWHQSPFQGAIAGSVTMRFSGSAGYDLSADNFGHNPVPEPATYALLGLGLAGLGILRRRVVAKQKLE